MPDIIDELIKREGGYTNNPADRGGPTKFGVTLRSLSKYRGRQCTIEDIMNLQMPEARAIYQQEYIDEPGFNRISDKAVREQTVDAGVLHGQGRATRWLQEAARVVVDGKLGPKTIAAVNFLPPEVLVRRFAAIRIRFLGRLITNDHSQATFAAGWMNRATLWLDQ